MGGSQSSWDIPQSVFDGEPGPYQVQARTPHDEHAEHLKLVRSVDGGSASTTCLFVFLKVYKESDRIRKEACDGWPCAFHGVARQTTETTRVTGKKSRSNLGTLVNNQKALKQDFRRWQPPKRYQTEFDPTCHYTTTIKRLSKTTTNLRFGSKTRCCDSVFLTAVSSSWRVDRKLRHLARPSERASETYGNYIPMHSR